MVRIHPFDDGNGRGARILMNLILMKKGFVPAIIEVSRRKQYIDALVDADAGNLNAFVMLVVDALIRTQQSVLSALSETAE
jgi:Fic family protein